MPFHHAGRTARSHKVCAPLNRALLASVATLALALTASPGFAGTTTGNLNYTGGAGLASTTGSIVNAGTGTPTYTDYGSNQELATVMVPGQSLSTFISDITANNLTINNTAGGNDHAALFNTFGGAHNANITTQDPLVFLVTGTNSITDTEVTASGGLGAAFYGLQTDTTGSDGGTVSFDSSGDTASSFTGNTGIYINNMGGSSSIVTSAADTINAISGSTGAGISIQTANYGNVFVVNRANETGTFGDYGMNLLTVGSSFIVVSNSGALSGATGAIFAHTVAGSIRLGMDPTFATFPGLTGAMTGGIVAITTGGGDITVATGTGGTINSATTNGINTSIQSSNANTLITVGDSIGAISAPSSSGVVAGTTGTGTIGITANANITGGIYGIRIIGGGGAVNITTASGTTVTGGTWGVFGDVGVDTVTVAGKVAGNITLSTGSANSLTLTSSGVATDGVVTGSISGGAASALTLNGTGSVTQDISALSGFATVAKSGTGTWTLTGTSAINPNYSITNGLLQIGNGVSNASLGTGTITITSGGLILNPAGSSTLANAIGGGGVVTKVGSGTVVLTGSNSYSLTTISGGTIQVGANGTTGTLGSGNVTDNGALIINRSNAYNQTTIIGGTGSLTQAGIGTATIFSTSAYTGATTINPTTTLALSDTGSIATSSGLTDNGTFDITFLSGLGTSIASLSGTGTVTAAGKSLTITAGAGTFLGTINTTGGVTISGGTETFNSTQTYTGGTTINSGAALVLGASGSVAGAITDNGTLGYGSTGTVTLTSFTGITGSGGIAEVGGGTLLVNTQSPLTGTSAVTSGTLIVGDINNPTASLGGGVLVGSLGTLEGHGTVNGAVTVVSGGTVKAGASIGTLSVNGTVALPVGTTFIEEFSNSAGSKLAATGAVTLGGKLQLVSDSATYTAGTDYKFITASSVTGTFSSVAGAPSGINTTVQYSASAVDLILGTPSATPAVATTFLFNTYGKTPNQIAAGAALTASSSTAPLYLALGTVVSTNTAAVPVTLGQLAGDIHPSLRSAAIEDARMIRDTMLGHMNRDPDGPILWAAGFGNVGNISDSNAANLGHRSGGFLVGGDIPVAATGNHLRLGLSGGYSTDNASTSGHLSTANGNEGHAGGYVAFTADQVHFYLGDDYGFGSVKLARAVSTLGAVLNSSQSQHSNQLFAELGYRSPWDLPLEPYLGIARVSSGQGAFVETGGIAALSGAAASDSEAFTTIGLRSELTDPITLGDINLMPHIDLGWQHAFQKLTPSQSVTFQSTGQSFLVLGVPLSNDAAKIKAGVEVKQGPATLFLDYDGEFASRVSENGISGGIDWQF
jgi:fibronectin-binding autotransporter adhesin